MARGNALFDKMVAIGKIPARSTVDEKEAKRAAKPVKHQDGKKNKK